MEFIVKIDTEMGEGHEQALLTDALMELTDRIGGGDEDPGYKWSVSATSKKTGAIVFGYSAEV